MKNLTKHTQTELLKIVNETETAHTNLKKDIILDSYNIEKLEKEVNEKLVKLEELEKKYIILIDEINNR